MTDLLSGEDYVTISAIKPMLQHICEDAVWSVITKFQNTSLYTSHVLAIILTHYYVAFSRLLQYALILRPRLSFASNTNTILYVD